MKGKIVVLALVLGFFAILPRFGQLSANEGNIELSNVGGGRSRCFATSILMPTQTFQILMSCRDIIYPAGIDVFNYIVWSEAQDGDINRLGDLGVGKVVFDTNDAFVELFVTREKSSRPRSPQGPIEMRGAVQRINFLYEESSEADIVGNNLTDNNDTADSIADTVVNETSVEKEEGSSISKTLATGGVIGFVLLFLVVALVFVITRR